MDQRVFLNISTCAGWSGPPTGIIRTERELALRLKTLLGKQAEFVIWDSEAEAFRLIDATMGFSLITGKAALQVGRNGLALADYAAGVVAPNCRDLVINLGFDWENPGSARAMYHAKSRLRFRCLALVFDMVPALFPHFSPASYRDRVKEYFWETMWLADKVLCISQAVQSELQSFRSANKFPLIPIGVCHLGVDESWLDWREDVPSDPIGKPYLLYVSTLEPRKNHSVLYRAWDEALRLGEIDREQSRLVFVGRRGWGVNDLLDQIDTNPRTGRSILILQDVDEEALKALMFHAAAVLYPSFYEGFGLPVAEALSFRVPVVASRIDALQEVGGNTVDYIDPDDGPGWRAAIVRALNDPCRRDASARRIEASHCLRSWDAAARNLLDQIEVW